jgi:putative AlgH/UPF0301 family transcriptional regulator
MGVFERAVVLVLEHSDRKGSVGLILNLPSPLLVNDVAWQLPAVKGAGIAWISSGQYLEASLPAWCWFVESTAVIFTSASCAGVFGTRRLYLGGPMQTDRMHALHTQAGISGATAIVPGVFVGGLEDLLEKVLSGEGSASGVRCADATARKL